MYLIEIIKFKKCSPKLQKRGLFTYGWCNCKVCKGGFGFGYVGKKKGWSVKFFGKE
jgi:hypothetical protein